MQLDQALFRISITLLLIGISYAQSSDKKEEDNAKSNQGNQLDKKEEANIDVNEENQSKIPIILDPVDNTPVPWPFQYIIPFQNALGSKPAVSLGQRAPAPAPGGRPSPSRPADRANSAQAVVTATIYQLKTAIEVVHLRHASLVDFIRCSIPDIPETCSKYEPKPFVWNWSLFIPPGFTVDTFFELQVPEQLTAIFAVFRDVLEHLHDIQKFTLEFISCSCRKNTTCAAQQDLQHLFSGNIFQNIFGSHVPSGGWGVGGGANRPSGSSIFGSGVSKPVVMPFNQGNTTGVTYTGTIDGGDGRPSGSYSGSVYGGPNSGGSYSSFSSGNRPLSENWSGNFGGSRPQGVGSGIGSGIGTGLGSGIGSGLGSGIGSGLGGGLGSGYGTGIGSGLGSGIGSGLGGGIGSGAGSGLGGGSGAGSGLGGGSGILGGNRPQGLGGGGIGSGGDLLGLGVDGSLYGSAIGIPLGVGGGIYGGVRPQEGGLFGNAGGGLGALLGGSSSARPQLFGGLNGLFGGGRPQGGESGNFGGGLPLGLGAGIYGGGGLSGLEAGIYGGTVPGLFGEISGGIGPRPYHQNRPGAGGQGGIGVYSHPELGGQGFSGASASASSAASGSSEGGSLVSASTAPDKGSAATESAGGLGLSFNINANLGGENKTLSNS